MHMYPYLLQSGAIPPMPGMSFPPPLPFPHVASPASFSNPAAHPIGPAHLGQPSALLPTPAANDRRSEVMDVDKEDGELSEGDQAVPSLAGHDRRHPEPPRSVPHSKPTAQARPREQPAEISDPASTIAQQREDAKQFIRLLHQNKVGYRNLADEGLDAASLRGLYRSLNLPSEPEPVPPPKPSNTAPTLAPLPEASSGRTSLHSTNDTKLTGTPPAKAAPSAIDRLANATQLPAAKPTPTIKTNVAVIPPGKAAPSPVDRQAYIARLQAAKLAKQGAKVTPPQKTPPATVAPFGATPQSTAATRAEKAKDAQIEVIRQRMEALKKTSSSPAAPIASRLPVASPTLVEVPSSSHLQTPSSTNAQVPANAPSSSFSGIPGLFMNAQSATQIPSTPTQVTNGAGTRKRPHDFEPVVATIASKLSLEHNQTSRDELASEQIVEDASDGEYEGSEMDLSDDHLQKPSVVALPMSNSNIQGSFQAAPLLPNFPSRSGSARPGVSTTSTPGPQTPGSQARSEQMDDTGLAMARLKAEIQRKQREKRERELLAAKASPILTATAHGSSKQPKGGPEQQPVVFTSRSGPMPQSLEGNVPPANQEVARESKRRRRAEIESGLPSLDAEIANNAVRMAELTKQMEELAAHNEKMQQDKERLIQELENLGIDTEGMPHAELQAKKDEIEREREAMSESGVDESALPATLPSRLENEANDNVARVISPAQQFKIPGLSAAVVQHSANKSPPATVHAALTSEATPEPASNAAATTGEPLQPFHHPTTVESAHENGTEAPGPPRHTTSGDDEEDDFYSPAPPDDFSTIAEASEPVISHANAPSPSEEGEVAMSESEEEYEPDEPDEPAALALTAVSHVGGHDIVAESSSASSLTSSDDEEGYEPPEIDQPMVDIQPNQTSVNNNAPVKSAWASLPAVEEVTHFPINPPTVQPSQQGEADDGAMDISSSSDGSDESESPSPSAADNASPKPIAFNTRVDEYIPIADDLAPELQVEPATASAVEGSVRI